MWHKPFFIQSRSWICPGFNCFHSSITTGIRQLDIRVCSIYIINMKSDRDVANRNYSLFLFFLKEVQLKFSKCVCFVFLFFSFLPVKLVNSCMWTGVDAFQMATNSLPCYTLLHNHVWWVKQLCTGISYAYFITEKLITMQLYLLKVPVHRQDMRPKFLPV